MTTLTVLDIHSGIGKAAVYTVDSANPLDETPLTNPRGNLSRVKFHTDFEYPKIINDVTVSVTLPAIGSRGGRVTTYNLFAHGQAGIPFCLGAFQGGLLTSEWQPVTASAPVTGKVVNAYTTYDGRSVSTHEGFQGQMISLGANSTYVVLQECSATPFSCPAITLAIRVLLTDELL